jgi:hypothetical protein
VSGRRHSLWKCQGGDIDLDSIKCQEKEIQYTCQGGDLAPDRIKCHEREDICLQKVSGRRHSSGKDKV